VSYLRRRTGVSRTITGDMLRSRFDTFAETRDGINELFDQPGSEYSRNLFSKGLPVPVCESDLFLELRARAKPSSSQTLAGMACSLCLLPLSGASTARQRSSGALSTTQGSVVSIHATSLV